MLKFIKGSIIEFFGIIAILFLIEMAFADINYNCILRVPISTDYDSMEDAMLLALSVPELMEKIYPDYLKYIILLGRLTKNIEKKQEISNDDAQEYMQLKKKLGVLLRAYNIKATDLWVNSGKRGCRLENSEGSRLFAEWKDSNIPYKWLEGHSDIQGKMKRFFGALNFGNRYTPTNHFDVFVKAKDGTKFIYTQHIHSYLFMIDLFALIALEGGMVHIFPGSQGTIEREGVYQFYTEHYGDRLMQIDSNGLFSIPAVDAHITRLMDSQKQLPSQTLNRAL